jgi:hypothetical protein
MPDDDREVVPADRARRHVGHRCLYAGLSAVAVALLLTTARAQTPTTCPQRLTWDASPEPDVTGYEVSWGPLPGAYRRSVLVMAPAVEATVNVAHGTSYVAVRAFSPERWASEYSEPIRVTCDVGDERTPPRVTSVTSLVLRG